MARSPGTRSSSTPFRSNSSIEPEPGTMATAFRIHPAIGIARLGNSPTSFYIAPEAAGLLPIECDQNGNPAVKDGKEARATSFKENGQIRRQAARFQVFVY